MSDTQPLLDRATALRNRCREKTRWLSFGTPGTTLAEKAEPVLSDLIRELIARTAKIVELEGDVERLRANQRDLEAERNGWRQRARRAVEEASAEMETVWQAADDWCWCGVCCYPKDECSCRSEASE